eukprot:1790597-Rhodomonas_salina.4
MQPDNRYGYLQQISTYHTPKSLNLPTWALFQLHTCPHTVIPLPWNSLNSFPVFILPSTSPSYKPYHASDPSLCPPAHAHPGPYFSDHTGAYYLIELIVAETRRGSEPVYTIKWVGWAHKHNSIADHSFLINEPGGKIAIEAWQMRHASVPTTAARNRAAKHLYCGPRTPAPQLLPNPPPVPPPALPPVAPPAPSPAPPAPPRRRAPPVPSSRRSAPRAQARVPCSGR